jgi:predicted transposase/invertase (TIGR01784 family)
MVYYLSKVYAGQLVAGESYYQLRPVISIHFIDYEQYPKRTAFHFCFECRERHYRKLCLTKDLAVHLIELPKFEKRLAQAQVTHDDLSDWLHFFNHAPEEEEKTMRTYYQTPLINKAFDVLEQLSADDATRQLAESREKALRDEASIQWELQEARQKVVQARQKVAQARQKVVKARQEGRQEGKQDLVKQLLASGRLTREELAQATGLGLAELQELSK